MFQWVPKNICKKFKLLAILSLISLALSIYSIASKRSTKVYITHILFECSNAEATNAVKYYGHGFYFAYIFENFTPRRKNLTQCSLNLEKCE